MTERPADLETLAAASREQARERELGLPGADLLAEVELPATQSERLTKALRAPGLSLIAEHKRRSPTRGSIREDRELEEILRAYEAGGARAISILTEKEHFGGSMGDLDRGRKATELPLQRKDFITISYQVFETKAKGAEAVLFITDLFKDDYQQLWKLHATAQTLGLETVLEIRDESQIEQARDLRPTAVGINNRDLSSPETPTDWETVRRLLALVPPEIPVIAESGYDASEESVAELEVLRQAGLAGVLVGKAVMEAEDQEATVRRLASIGRQLTD